MRPGTGVSREVEPRAANPCSMSEIGFFRMGTLPLSSPMTPWLSLQYDRRQPVVNQQSVRRPALFDEPPMSHRDLARVSSLSINSRLHIVCSSPSRLNRSGHVRRFPWRMHARDKHQIRSVRTTRLLVLPARDSNFPMKRTTRNSFP